MGCTPSTDKGSAGADQSLVGQASNSQSAPLLGGNRPTGKLKDFSLSFDATEDQQLNAAIVISWPLPTEDAAQDGEVALDPNDALRKDLLMRLSAADLEFSSMKSADGDEAFILINATEDRLMECAEFQHHELRLKKSWQVPYAPFTIARKDDFVWEDKIINKLFSLRDRQALVMRILEVGDYNSVDEMDSFLWRNDNAMWRAKYGQNKKKTCGLTLDDYVTDGVLNGYWAMHGHVRRNELLHSWAAFSRFWSPQPLKLVHEYFNSKTALYFAFIGYYTAWLSVSAVFGVAVQAFDSLKIDASEGDDGNVMMCYFSFFMALWGTLFLEFWKRYNAELAYRWSTVNLEQEASERMEFRRGTKSVTRQGFYASSGHFVPYDEDLEPHGCLNHLCACGMSFSDDVEEDVDHNTRQQILLRAPLEVPYMDQRTRMNRIFINYGVALTFTVAVLSILMSFLVLRLVFQKMLDASMGGILASTLQALTTVLLNTVYQDIAIRMVDYENYRTDSEWENAVIYKVFGFQFINSYFSLFYIAFLKGKIGDLDGYSDQCKDTTTGLPADNCMGELFTLLLSTLLTTQILSTLVEGLLPYITYKIVLWSERAKWAADGRTGELELSDIDHESKLVAAWKLDAFTDYNKMAIQFGYVSMFVAAFPLAPFCALLNNLVEIRTDAIKRVVAMQRPAPSERAENIGAWMTILELMNLAAVATNVGVICFTSNVFADHFKLSQHDRVWAFIILEHIIILAKLFLASCISDVPEWVTLRLARDEYMLNCRQIIAESESEAFEQSHETLMKMGGVTLETDGAKAPMTSNKSLL